VTAWAWVLVGLAVLVVTVVGCAVLALVRFRQLCSQAGSFVCWMRPGPEARWHTGVGHYGVMELSWWRGQSLAFTPARQWNRRELQIVEHSHLDQPHRPDLYRVRCRYGDGTVELTLSASAYAGLASWLESSPPEGRGLVV